MLRVDTLAELEAAMTAGRSVVPTADLRRAIETRARAERARMLGDFLKTVFDAITGRRPLEIRAGSIDVVHGH